jgi:hypothetical protein
LGDGVLLGLVCSVLLGLVLFGGAGGGEMVALYGATSSYLPASINQVLLVRASPDTATAVAASASVHQALLA